jgi:peroxiredoxin
MKFLVATICALFFATLNVHAQAYTDSNLAKLTPLPNVVSLRLDSSKTTLNKLMKADTPNVVLFFSPDCDHCQEEISNIRDHIDTMKDINFILVTNRPPFMIKPFVKEYKLGKIKNFTFLSDYGNSLTRHFGFSSNPSMFIYNKQGKCVAGYNSAMVPISIIINKSKIITAQN